LKIININIKGFDEYLAMQYKYLFLAFLVVTVALLESCSKGGTVCDDTLKPKVDANTPIGQNDTLILSVFGISEPKTYSWTGPNGFSSNQSKPVIINPVKGKQVYKVDVVTQGGCTYSASSQEVTVTGPWNPCGLDSNTVRIVSVSRFSLSSVVGTAAGNGDYRIEGFSSGARITMDFPNNQPPAEGIYNVSATTSALPLNAVRVVVKTSTTAAYTTGSGQVYVAVDGANTTISFCDLPFTTTEETGVRNGSANFIWTPAP
jgi:hypothetical protein